MLTIPSHKTTGRWVGQFPPLERNLWLLASAVILLNATSQLLVSGTADQDQAGELLRSQWWAWGYGSQPPLYTWIVKLIFEITGPSLWALQAIKASLLSTLIAAALAMGVRLKFSASQQLINLCGFTLIPQFLWESQRDLTHSVLAAVIAALTVLHWLNLERQQSWTNYAIAGVLAAAGLLSKYNYALLLAGLVVSSLTVPPYRKTIFNPKSFLSLLIATLATAPHILWAVKYPDLALGSMDKLDSEKMGLITIVTSLLNALTSASAFLGPLLIAMLILLWGKRLKLSSQSGEILLRRLPLTIGLLLTAVIFVTGATRIKDRWYQSLLVTTPVLVASLAGAQPSKRRKNMFILISATAVVSSSLMLPGRTIFAGLTGKVSRPNMPLPALLQAIRAENNDPKLIFASDNLLAGNARLVFPDSLILSEKATHVPPGYLKMGSKLTNFLALVSSNEYAAKEEAPSLKQLLKLYGIKENQLPVQTVTKPLLWASEKSYSLTWTAVQLPKPERL